MKNKRHNDLFQRPIPIFNGSVVIYIIRKIYSIWKNMRRKELGMAVLGENQSGKTLWYDFLCNTNFHGAHTMEREIDAFDFKYDDGRTVHVRKGKDINGDKHFMSIYEAMIKENDVIMFFNNIDLYIHDVNYRRDVNGRLDFIFHHLGTGNDKKLYIMWSYADKLDNRAQGFDEAKCLFQKRQIGNPTEYVLINMTDQNEVKKFANKFFNI